MADQRKEFLARHVQCIGLDAGAVIITEFELLDDDAQNAVEKNLMHIYSRTWCEQLLWNYIEKHGLRVDR